IPRTETGKVRRQILTELYSDAAPKTAAPSAAAAATDAALSPREEEIAAIWRDVLGVPHIGRNETFFELGGDSLSVIGAMLKMERAGIAKDMAQAMLEGRSIAEIAAMEPGARAAVGAQARTSDAINMTRGLLVMVVIAAHWGPFFIARAGRFRELAGELVNPIFRLGTPGFAIVFGIGLSFFYLPSLRRHPDRFRAKLRTNAIVLAVGVFIIGLTRNATVLIEQGSIGPQWAASFFYNVLFFYLLMVLSAGLVLRGVARMRHQALDALLCVVGLLLASALFRLWLGHVPATGLAELGRLMLVAKYSYPAMLAEVMVGIALGYWIEQSMAEPDQGAKLVRAGLALLGGGLVLSFELGLMAAWRGMAANVLMLVSYAGAILLLFAGMSRWRAGASARASIVATRLLLILGLLAFPAFVGHEAVMGIKELLRAFGMSNAASIGLPLAVLIGAGAVAIRRIYRLYYG
uniref:phosphopantetheine-binding protein n=1 Tax=Sphingomonas sp. TaxID=28214 RepID=UPI003B3ADEA8